MERIADDAVLCGDPLKTYLTELRRIVPMDRAEEEAYIAHLIAGDAMAEAANL